MRKWTRFGAAVILALTLCLTFAAGVLLALVTALAKAAHRETARRTEARLLAQRFELAQNSYEAMRRQNEQVMMLRHDMMKHFRMLRQTVTDEKAAAYLDELIGENEKIRPVVQSGNEMLDVILNGKLSAAADAGIAVEIARMKAPGHGLGLKIIKQIVARYDDLMETEYGTDYYSVKMAIPLS